MTKNRLIQTVVLLVILRYSHITNAQTIPNGDFNSGLSGWTTRGNVTVQSNAGNNVAVFAEINSGGLSSLARTFTLPASSTWLSFRYRLFSGTNSMGTVPPDSFTAYLLNSSGQRLIAQGAEPAFTKAILYEDERGELLYPTAQVIREPSGQGQLYRVRIPVSGLPQQAVTVRFVFDNAANGAASHAILDDVAINCPTGHCCNLVAGSFEIIDDGLPCTNDQCVNGAVTHTPYLCCGECDDSSNNEPISIAIMVDVTSSTSQSDFNAAKQAILQLLTWFEARSYRPRISVGRFSTNVHSFGAKIDVALPSQPPTNYNYVRNVINSPTLFPRSGGRTPLNRPLISARDELLTRPNDRHYICIITDGWINEPDQTTDTINSQNNLCNTNGSNCNPNPPLPACACECSYARGYAETIRNGLPEDMEVMVIYYIGTGDSAPCNTQVHINLARAWLRDSIATTEYYFMDTTDPNNVPPGSPPLSCAFIQIAELINCDDGVDCTVDHCEFGVCVHDPCP